MKKTIVRAIIALLLGIIVITIYLYGRGYICYKKAIKNVSLEDRINQIRSSEKFVSWDEMPDDYKNAVIAVEDHRFMEHGTVDFIAILRALTSNFRKKELAEGGSTITQQVVKNLYFMEADTKNDSIDRKIAEIIMGAKIENTYSKEEIFELKFAIESLDERDKSIIKMYYGIDCEEKSQVEIANIFNISQAQISRIINSIYKKLRNIINEKTKIIPIKTT